MAPGGTGRSGRAVLADVRRRLAGDGWPPGLTVLTGPDAFHLDAAQRDLLAALVPAEDAAFALTVFGDEPVSGPEVVDAARSLGMFAPRRVVLVRDVAAIALGRESEVESACEAFAAYDASPPPGSHILVRAPRLDVRRRFHKVLAAARHALVFEPSPETFAADVAEMAAARGLSLTREAVEILGALCVDPRSGESDLYRAQGELDKLAAWTAGSPGRSVDGAAVAQLATGGGGPTAFEVVDAVAARDGAWAQRAAREMIDRGEHPLPLLGLLAWRCRGLLQAKAMLAARVPEQAVKQATRVFRLDVLRVWRMDELLAAPAALLRADRLLKSGGEPRAVMQGLIAELTERG
jgi:DNA polymerase-3 subunit delta